MKSLARSYGWRPKMHATIEELIRLYLSCQHIQKTPPNFPQRKWSSTGAPWQRVNVDFFGPFWGQMSLVVVDCLDR